MFNLLPEIEKKSILQEYFRRKIIVLLLFLFVTGIVAVTFLFPSRILSLSKVTEIGKQIEAIRNSTLFKEADALNKVFSETNLKLTALHTSTGTVSVTNTFEKVLDKKTTKIRINNISYRKAVGKDPNTVTLTGVALDRESLSAFVRSLQSEPAFTKVNLPVSNFTKNKNLDFSIHIIGNF